MLIISGNKSSYNREILN